MVLYFEFFVWFQPAGHRIAKGFSRGDTNIGSDHGQDLVARDDDLQLFTVQADMFRGMATANKDVPGIVTYHDVFTIT